MRTAIICSAAVLMAACGVETTSESVPGDETGTVSQAISGCVPTGWAPGGYPYYLSGDAIVYPSPSSTSCPACKPTPAGQLLSIIQSCPTNGFYKVYMNGPGTGWVWSSRIGGWSCTSTGCLYAPPY